VNSRGEVIGINTAIASGTGYFSGYGFAIPISLAKQVMDDLIKYGTVKRAIVGVYLDEVDAATAKAVGLTHAAGAKIIGFGDDTLNSPGRKAGLELNDVVVEADGKPVDQVNTLQRIIRAHKPGDVVEMEVMRFGNKKSFKVRLAEAPDAPAVVASNDSDGPGMRSRPTNNRATARSMDKLGISVEPVPTEFAESYKLEGEARSGLRITSVAGNGPSYHALQQNEIILGVLGPVRRDLKSVDDLEHVLSGLKNGDVITLKVCFPNPSDGSCASNVASVQIEK
jgi:serine protease Do